MLFLLLTNKYYATFNILIEYRNKNSKQKYNIVKNNKNKKDKNRNLQKIKLFYNKQKLHKKKEIILYIIQQKQKQTLNCWCQKYIDT